MKGRKEGRNGGRNEGRADRLRPSVTLPRFRSNLGDTNYYRQDIGDVFFFWEPAYALDGICEATP